MFDPVCTPITITYFTCLISPHHILVLYQWLIGFYQLSYHNFVFVSESPIPGPVCTIVRKRHNPEPEWDHRPHDNHPLSGRNQALELERLIGNSRMTTWTATYHGTAMPRHNAHIALQAIGIGAHC